MQTIFLPAERIKALLIPLPV